MPKAQAGVITKTRSVPLGTYPSGTRNFGPLSLVNGLNNFDIRIGRCTTADPTIWANEATLVTIDLQFSYDAGATWTPVGTNSWTGSGGIKTIRGVELPEEILSWGFSPDEPNAMKGTITVANGPIKTYMDVTIET